MKCRIILITLFALCILNITASAEFEKGEVYNSSVNGFADGYPIPVYNYMDYPYIMARDLNGYCFDVVYNDEDRTVTVSHNPDKALSPYEYAGNEKELGKKLGTISKSDILVYINGEKVQSYNMNGNMFICMDDLDKCGSVVWYEESKTIAFTSKTFEEKNPEWKMIMPEKYENYRNNVIKANENYYPDSEVASYTALTGVENEDVYITDNTKVYIYPFDSESVLQYINLMCDYLGYSLYDKDSDIFGTNITYTLEKDNVFVEISVQYLYNQVWISF